MSPLQIPSVSMDQNIEYLLGFLKDEFRDFSEIRIHPVAPSGTKKSMDLPQNYDPETHSVHLNRGVRIRVMSRDYFFPVDWVIQGKYSVIQELANEVREYALSQQL
jgi:hypothetical protein